MFKLLKTIKANKFFGSAAYFHKCAEHELINLIRQNSEFRIDRNIFSKGKEIHGEGIKIVRGNDKYSLLDKDPNFECEYKYIVRKDLFEKMVQIVENRITLSEVIDIVIRNKGKKVKSEYEVLYFFDDPDIDVMESVSGLNKPCILNKSLLIPSYIWRQMREDGFFRF